MENNRKNYINKIAETKILYHKEKAKVSYEEKFKIILELQKIDIEMMKRNKHRANGNRYRKLWELEN
ncbi:MAG: hypothetical protein WAR79_20790 [Melioribacteraceae bacterium]